MSPALETRQASDWLTKEQAALRLGISRETLDKWIRERKLATISQPRQGMRARKLVNPADVERLRSGQKTDVVLQGERAVNALLPRATQWANNGLTNSPKPFLELHAAADWSGLPANLLHTLIREKALPAREHNHLWYVARRDLESLELDTRNDRKAEE